MNIQSMKLSCRFIIVTLCLMSSFPVSPLVAQMNELNEKNLGETMRNSWNPDQSFFKQAAQLEVYGSGRKMIARKSIGCCDSIDCDYSRWDNGVYELRLIYEDIKGEKATKYVSWYKETYVRKRGGRHAC